MRILGFVLSLPRISDTLLGLLPGCDAAGFLGFAILRAGYPYSLLRVDLAAY